MSVCVFGTFVRVFFFSKRRQRHRSDFVQGFGPESIDIAIFSRQNVAANVVDVDHFGVVFHRRSINGMRRIGLV